MSNKTDSEFISTYEALMQAQKDGTFGASDAVTLVVVSVELGRRGYTLTDDESTWIREHRAMRPTSNFCAKRRTS